MTAGRLIAMTAVVLVLDSGRAALVAQKSAVLPTTGDLNAAQLVEVRDQAGQVLLHGTLKTSSNSAKETERKAELVSPSGQKAKGKIEIEIEREDGIVKDEVDVSAHGLPSMVQLELMLDGRHAAAFVTSKTGRADFEVERKTTGR
jgi:hypothetical protein